MKIIKNAIRCNLCGDEIESKHHYDFVYCSCRACFVDGGRDYLRRGGSNYTELSEIEPQEESEPNA